MFICWCYCYSIKSNAFAMMVDIVGAYDGGEFVIHGVANLLAHRAFSDIISNKALGNLVAWEPFAESKVGGAITKVTIAAAMDGVESGADIVFCNDGNGALRGSIRGRK